VLDTLDDGQAESVVTIDLEGKTSIADYMVIASGRSARQVGALAQHLIDRLKTPGSAGPRVQGAAQGDWVVIDAGDVIVHLFRPEVREFYNLERMWSLDLPGERAAL
jgi:ribosome-associated protein